MPQVERFIQQALTHSAPVLADGVAAQQLTHRVPDGGQTLQTLNIYEQAAHAAAHVLFTPDTHTIKDESGRGLLYKSDWGLIHPCKISQQALMDKKGLNAFRVKPFIHCLFLYLSIHPSVILLSIYLSNVSPNSLPFLFTRQKNKTISDNICVYSDNRNLIQIHSTKKFNYKRIKSPT